ncbi:MAG: hypothetical protein AAFQ20_00025 [Bacteroidota bacterium]
MKNSIDVFDINAQRKVGAFPIERLDKMYDEWRAKGMGVLLDRDGDICLDDEEPEDDGLYYSEQVKDLDKWKRATNIEDK